MAGIGIYETIATTIQSAVASVFLFAMLLLAGGLISFLTEIQIAVGRRRTHMAHTRQARPK